MKRSVLLFTVFSLVILFHPGHAVAKINKGAGEEGKHLLLEESVVAAWEEASYSHLGEKVCEVNLQSSKHVASKEYDLRIEDNIVGHIDSSDQYTVVITNQGDQPISFRIGYDNGKKARRVCAESLRMFTELSSGVVEPGRTKQVNKIELQGTMNKFFLESRAPRKKSRSCVGSLFTAFSSEFVVGAEGTLTVYKKVAEETKGSSA